MDWTASVDAYCERTDPSFWAEPLNAVSNLSFLLAALYGVHLLGRCRERDFGLAALSLTAAVVGVGSFLFHTVATRWAALADVIPIAVFIALGFGLVLRRLVGLGPWISVAATAVFMAASGPIGAAFEPLVGSSAGYAPALLALLLIGGWLSARGVPNGRFVLVAGGVFAVSLLFRMADLPFCQTLPQGTHVGWHVLNGVVLALVIRSVCTWNAGKEMRVNRSS
ncbi:ceramidase domain-containing protein [Chthonobacter rhizosphaerae]|uniref:ceramidase domain-containing protein n=1 Tax=Chthonobacter rhizosphaerae TaxID=2735553 RepID=UPI0015EEAFC5|nr:ceramidase domain-containing protein [Chthonobacter rhizosphaerae]